MSLIHSIVARTLLLFSSPCSVIDNPKPKLQSRSKVSLNRRRPK